MNEQQRALSQHWELYQEALQASNLEQIQRVVAGFARRMGFHNHGYAQRSTAAHDGYRYFHDFDPEWAQQYKTLSSPQAEKSDPRIIQARQWYPAVSWNSLGRYSYEKSEPFMRQAVRRRLQYTGEFNIHGGITVPIRAPGIEWGFMSLTLGHRVAIEEFSPLLLSATYFTNCLQAALARMAAESAPHAPDLSVRETEVLRWSALGKTSWEISAILRISEATVNFHVKRVAAKLGVKGRRAAVARAIALDAIRL